MIRNFQESDTEQVMQIWLNGNIEAHSFISKSYWQSNFEDVQEQIVQAEVFVYEADKKIQGFIGIVKGYIAGIFVDKTYRSLGIGKQLLDYAKKRYCSLRLEVYQKNKQAVDFYFREGFSIEAEGFDEETGEMEYTMLWTASMETDKDWEW